MAKDIDLLLRQVMPYAPACPEPLAIRHLRDAAIRLCERTKLWRDTDSFTVTTPESEGVCTIQDARLLEIRAARLDDQPLTPVTQDWLDDEFPDWEDVVEVADPKYVTQSAPNTVTLFPKATGTLSLRLILVPSEDATTLPDFLVDQYALEIGWGAAGEILTTPNAEFANPQLGLDFRARFEDRLNTLAWRATRGQHVAPLRTRGKYL